MVMEASKLIAFWDHPAGPKTNIIGNIADFTKPPEKVSYPQQTAVTASGLISVLWSRYSMVITPKNWNLFSLNVAMAGTGIYQMSRKIKHDYFSETKDVAGKE